MRRTRAAAYNAGMGEHTADDEAADEAGRSPLAPIPLPPDPLGHWLDHRAGDVDGTDEADDAP